MKATLPSSFPTFPPLIGSDDDGQLLPPTHRRCRCQLDTAVVDVPLGPSIQELFECNAALKPGQVRPEAETQTVAKGHVLPVVSPYVVRRRVFESPGVTVGGSHQQE